MFYLIGLGLGDIKDITVNGLEIVKKCKKVFLEAYTSILSQNGDKTSLEEFFQREIIIADRELVESGSDIILDEAKENDIALLVVGDPLGATTHTDIILRAIKNDIKYKIIHNASILTAIGCCGLQLYSFGETVSIPFWTDTWRPESFYDKILINYNLNLHTLCLLDIKVKEKSIEALMRGKEVYEEPRFMSVNVAAKQLIEIMKQRSVAQGNNLTGDSMSVGLSRVGSDDQKIIYCSLNEMCSVNLGDPLHCLIIPAKLHPLEEEFLSFFKK